MAEQSIGRAALVLTTDQGPLDAGLQQVKAKVAAAGGEAGAAFTARAKARAESLSKLGSVLGGEGAEKGGKLGGLFGLAGPAALVAGAVALANQLATASAEAFRLKDALAESDRLGARVAANFAQFADARFKTIADLPQGLQLGDAVAKLKAAEKELSGIESGLNRAKDAAEGVGMSDFFSPEALRNFELFGSKVPLIGEAMTMGVKAAFDVARKDLEQQRKLYDAATESVKRLKDEVTRLRDPSRDPAVLKGVKDLTDRLREQAATYGMTAGEIEVFRLRQKGATDEQLTGIRQLIAADKTRQASALARQEAELAAQEAAKEAADRARDRVAAFDKVSPNAGALVGSREAIAMENRFKLEGSLAPNRQKELATLNRIESHLKQIAAKKSVEVLEG